MKFLKTIVLPGLIFLSLPMFAQDAGTTPPPIPEEARKHFVMGETLFKDAKTADDFVQAEREFKQAAELAPQFPQARYNLALAEEAAGDYAGAMADLKLYLAFKLPADEARVAQDKIYMLEAKQQKLAAAKAVEQRAADAQKEAENRMELAKKERQAWATGIVQWLKDNYSGRVEKSWTLVSFPKGGRIEDYENQWLASMTPDFKSYNLLSENNRFAFSVSGSDMDQITINGTSIHCIGIPFGAGVSDVKWTYNGGADSLKNNPEQLEFAESSQEHKPWIQEIYSFPNTELSRANRYILEGKK